MTCFTVGVFAGELPITDSRLLDSRQATEAVNCELVSGALRAMRGPGLVKNTASAARTLFKHDVDDWLTWDRCVSVVKSAVVDADGEKPLGQLLITGDREYPTMYLAGGEVYRLGIPRPAARPEVRVMSEAALGDVEAMAFAVGSLDSAPARYGYEGASIQTAEGITMSFSCTRTLRGVNASAATATVSTSSAEISGGGAAGGDMVCSGLVFDRGATLEAKRLHLNDTAFDGRTDWTTEEVAARIAEAGYDSVEDWWNAFGRDEGVCPWDSVSCCRKNGYTYYAGGSLLSIVRSSAYCYTVVQSLAGGLIRHESAPSPASAVIDVPDGDGVVVSGFTIPSLPDIRITHVRIYRTVSGAQSSDFRFLAELSVEELRGLGWKYVDTLHDKDVSGEILMTSAWDAIPDNARGLIKTDNGIYACFRGNELLVSEPFIPYAYPASYRLTVEDTIVALAHVDGTIVVLTTGRPYLAQGTAPESLNLVHLPIEQSCVSALSVATLPGGVMYASPDGLMWFTSNEQNLATGGTFSREQWRAMGPERLMGSVHDGRYVGFFEGSNKGFLYYIGRADVVRLELPEGWKVRALYHHSEDDALYLSVEAPEGNGIWQFEAENGDLLPYRWKSKLFFTSSLCAMSAARVRGEQNARNAVRMEIYGPDGKRARTSLRLTGDRAVRIRPMRSERVWSFRLSGTADVYEARMGGGVEEVEYGQ